MGQLLLHASGMRHAGNAISRGVRWVLVVFLVSTAVPQLARYSAHIAARAMLEASEAEGAGDGHLTLTYGGIINRGSDVHES